jgi:hypothetical protein
MWTSRDCRVTPTPAEGISPNALKSISCSSATNCYTVGQYTPGAGAEEALIEWWNGTSRSERNDVGVAGNDSNLNAVSCYAPGGLTSSLKFKIT